MDDTCTIRNISCKIAFALLSVYFFWGGTYLAIRIALESFPPFFMAGVRFVISGVLLYALLKVRGFETPTRPQWIGGTIIGAFLLVGGNGGVVFAEQWVPSGLAALGVATTPLWIVLFERIWGKWPTRLEWIGLLLGFTGIVILNFEADLRANPAGAVALILATLLWAFGSAWSRYLSLPSGFMLSAVEMISGGVLLLVVSALTGETVTAAPTEQSLLGLLYLIVFGSLFGFTAYVYLLKKVTPALATSYAYVNPLIAVGLGVGLAGETITEFGLIAMILIVIAVVMVILGQKRA